MEWILRSIVADLKNGEEKLNSIYEKLSASIIGMFLIIILMWVVNAFIGIKEINFIFFFLGGMAIVIMGFAPRVVGLSAVGGSITDGLEDKDLSQGAVRGIQVLYKVVTGILLGFWVTAGILATWSFKEAPIAFWPVAAMTMTIGLVVEYFDMKGGIFKWIVITYAVLVIALAFFQTVPQEWKNEVRSLAPVSNTTPSSKPVHKLSSELGVEQTILITKDVWSNPVRVGGDRCIRVWTDAAEKEDAIIQVRGVNDSTWYEWSDFLLKKKAGSLPYENFGWMRFHATDEPVLMHVIFLQPGQCN